MPKQPDDNLTFITKLMTYSRAGALIQGFVITALEYYSKTVLQHPNLDTGLINPEAWKLCAREVLEKLDKQYTRCGDCPFGPR